jgi:hypothetical protein
MTQFCVGDLVRPNIDLIKTHTDLRRSFDGVSLAAIWRVVEVREFTLLVMPVFGLFGTDQLLANRECYELDIVAVDIIELGKEFAALTGFINSEITLKQ